MADQVPKAVVTERYLRLTALQDEICLEENRRRIGSTVELLVVADADGKNGGRKNSETNRISGRARDGRLVHFVGDRAQIRAGDVVETEVTGALPHYLIADGPLRSHRRTRAGDASQAGRTAQTPPIGVGLGMPTIGRIDPPPAAAVGGCAGGCDV